MTVAWPSALLPPSLLWERVWVCAGAAEGAGVYMMGGGDQHGTDVSGVQSGLAAQLVWLSGMVMSVLARRAR